LGPYGLGKAKKGKKWIIPIGPGGAWKEKGVGGGCDSKPYRLKIGRRTGKKEVKKCLRGFTRSEERVEGKKESAVGKKGLEGTTRALSFDEGTNGKSI